MRNVAINDVDHLPRRVLALGSDYPPNTLLERHSHRRAQFLYAMHGLMKVGNGRRPVAGAAVQRVWIPATKPHRVWIARRQHPQPVY
ncbi:transcriptional regulator [Klebsiella michiganensis]|uniref:Transcriptional regulator n=1 Tax=Klebsiella michiganensis TaxID=1134687 RepID=A0A7H4N6L6_9ENTR|nr:transcriptional regulator [Klebsiella michiganensis]